MRRSRKAKIIATLGPSSSMPEMIYKLFHAGADVFRLNCSHGSQEEHRHRIFAIRQLERNMERPIGILMDLQGPKLRVGKMENGGVRLETGSEVRFDLWEEPGNSQRVPLLHPEVFSALNVGDLLLLDDGRLRVEILDCGEDYANTRVQTGGVLKDNKGVNLPGTMLPISSLTRKDREDLAFALDMGAHWIGLSFVQRPADVEEARELIGDQAAIMVKIEKPSAIEHLDRLIELADAVMVARGDLGVEMPAEVVPARQKQIVAACRKAGKPVVVATQMLESMIQAPRPTRAEASDVATAVYDGADAVMLSAETAAGEYPLEAVEIMDRIIGSTERDPTYGVLMKAQGSVPEATYADAISVAAAQVAETISAKAIVTYTMSGSTALRAARERPRVPILSLTNRPETAARLSLLWGAHPIITSDVSSTQEMVDKASHLVVKEGFAKPGDAVVVTAGLPFGTPGTTNVLRIAVVGGTSEQTAERTSFPTFVHSGQR